MSKNKKRIEKALNDKGYKAKHIEWTPIRVGPEMCGPVGGWLIETNINYICGYNIEEVIDIISELPQVSKHVRR